MNELRVEQKRPNRVEVLIGKDNGWVSATMSMGTLWVEVYGANGTPLNSFKMDWPDEKKKYKVRASYQAMCEAVIEANSLDEAYDLAKELDGGMFDTECDPDDWHIEDVEEIK